jgi:acetyltransferase
LIGVGRLVADPDHRNAEYAVLVSDVWQGRGLGSMLTDYCLEICSTWGINRVYAETTSDNARMQRILRRRVFVQTDAADNELLFQTQLDNRGDKSPTTNQTADHQPVIA